MKRAALLLGLALSSCTTGQSNATPAIGGGGGGGGNGSGAMQLAVGTANFAGFATGLNVLATFRDANGYTAIPITAASLTGPPSFRGLPGSSDPGDGKYGTIPIGSASNSFETGPAAPATEIAGVDGWGIGPPSCSCPGVNTYPMQPQYADNANLASTFPGGAEPIYGGPPAYPPAALEPSALSSLVSIPSQWSEGFYLIGVNHVPSGRYTIAASYQQDGVTKTSTAGASLDAAHVLPLFSVKGVAQRDGTVAISVHFPRGVVQAIVNVIDSNVPPAPGATCVTGLGFASVKFSRSGTVDIPNDLGNYGAGGAPTYCKGDLLLAQAFGFDYDDFDLGPPGNAQQSPHLPARADVTIALATLILVPGKPPMHTPRWPRFR